MPKDPAKQTERRRSEQSTAGRGESRPARKSVPTSKQSQSGQPGGGAGRIDVIGNVPEGVRIDPDVIEGHTGYQESGDSEIIPNERFTKQDLGGKANRSHKTGARPAKHPPAT